jgi:adenylate kinase
MLNLVLFGPPGAGKGTQSDKLIEKYKLVHLSTGDILRSEIKAQTKLGLDASERISKGELVPDAVVIGMIESKIDQHKNAPGFIFDGFPRTSAQAEVLDTLLEKRGTSISAMLSLEVDREELITRLLSRGKISGRADDQDLSIIENRIAVYNKETAPVMNHYKAQNKYKPIKGVGSIDDIFNSLCQVIDSLK